MRITNTRTIHNYLSTCNPKFLVGWTIGCRWYHIPEMTMEKPMEVVAFIDDVQLLLRPGTLV